MSMAWMRMPGQTWAGAAAMFAGMWIAMMVPMMLPSLIPMLRRYRRSVGAIGRIRGGGLTAIVAAAYFSVWTLCGVAAFFVGAALADLAMRHTVVARAVPIATGAVVLAAGALQMTAWKARQLACCRAPSREPALPADAGTAWRHGVQLGWQCGRCCANLMAILLVVGIMDVPAMAMVTAAITLARLAPAGARVARAIGVVTVGLAAVAIAHAAALG